MVEVREVLRGWLEGAGLRTVAERAGVDRKTARRYVTAAEAEGLTRDDDVGALTDELIASTIVTSNREPAEWLTMMSDALLAQSAVDRLTSGAHTLVIEGPSYRQRERLLQRTAVDTHQETQ